MFGQLARARIFKKARARTSPNQASLPSRVYMKGYCPRVGQDEPTPALLPFFWKNGRPMTIFHHTDTYIAILESADLGKRGGSPRFQRETAASRVRHLRFCKVPLRYLYLYFEILSLQP